MGSSARKGPKAHRPHTGPGTRRDLWALAHALPPAYCGEVDLPVWLIILFGLAPAVYAIGTGAWLVGLVRTVILFSDGPVGRRGWLEVAAWLVGSVAWAALMISDYGLRIATFIAFSPLALLGVLALAIGLFYRARRRADAKTWWPILGSGAVLLVVAAALWVGAPRLA